MHAAAVQATRGIFPVYHDESAMPDIKGCAAFRTTMKIPGKPKNSLPNLRLRCAAPLRAHPDRRRRPRLGIRPARCLLQYDGRGGSTRILPISTGKRRTFPLGGQLCPGELEGILRQKSGIDFGTLKDLIPLGGPVGTHHPPQDHGVEAVGSGREGVGDPPLAPKAIFTAAPSLFRQPKHLGRGSPLHAQGSRVGTRRRSLARSALPSWPSGAFPRGESGHYFRSRTPPVVLGSAG
jgi:hypothetical protein